ncbi:MAG: hypothetical protein K2Y31_10885, partial [Burkholderiales bacterium]|nr:hypothetical protein [Burkholderiales bacterium]
LAHILDMGRSKRLATDDFGHNASHEVMVNRPWNRPHCSRRDRRKKTAPRGAVAVDQPRDLFGALVIVFLAVDAPAFVVLGMVDFRALFFGHRAVGFRPVFHFFNSGLMPLQSRGFAFVQLAGLHALVDAFLLDFLALVDAGRRGGIFGLRVGQRGDGGDDGDSTDGFDIHVETPCKSGGAIPTCRLTPGRL